MEIYLRSWLSGPGCAVIPFMEALNIHKHYKHMLITSHSHSLDVSFILPVHIFLIHSALVYFY